jgi:hypothetical protein
MKAITLLVGVLAVLVSLTLILSISNGETVPPPDPRLIPPDRQSPETSQGKEKPFPTYWNGRSPAPNQWNDPQNWSSGVPQEKALTAIIDSDRVVVIAEDASAPETAVYVAGSRGGQIEHYDGKVSIASLHLGFSRNTAGSYYLNGSGVLQAKDEYIGENGAGTFNHASGSNIVANSMHVGSYSGSKGVYNLSGNGNLAIKGDLYIGSAGVGTFAQDAGTSSVKGDIYIGGSEAGGIYVISGPSQLTGGKTYIGYNGKQIGYGCFYQNGGSVELKNLLISRGGRYTMQLGSLAVGDITIEKGGVLDLDSLRITEFAVSGNQVTKLVEYIADGRICDSSMVQKAVLNVRYDVGTDRTVLMGDPNVSIAASTDWLEKGDGSWNIQKNWTKDIPDKDACARILNGGRCHISGRATCRPLYVGTARSGVVGHGDEEMSTGNPEPLNGTGPGGKCVLHDKAVLSAVTEYVGYEGVGRFIHSGGKNIVAAGLYVSGLEYGGTYDLYSGDLSIGHTLYIGGAGGNGTFTQFSGSNTVGMILRIDSDTYAGAYNLTNLGTLSVMRTLYVGGTGSATFNHTGGVSVIGGSVYLGGPSPGGVYNLSGDAALLVGGTMYVGGSHKAGGAGAVNQTGGKCKVGTLYIGGASSSGEYNLSGWAALEAQNIYIGGPEPDSGRACFNQTGGTLTADYFHIGSKGTCVINEGTVTLRYLVIDEGGVLRVDWGRVKSFGIIGNHADRLNKYIKESQLTDLNISRAPLKVAYSGGRTTVTYDKEALRRIESKERATSKVDSAGSFTRSDNGSPNLIIEDSPSEDTQVVYVGLGDFDTIRQKGHSHVEIGLALYLEGTKKAASYSLEDNASLFVKHAMFVGHYGAGTFEQKNGYCRVDGPIYVGGSKGASGALNISDGELVAQEIDMNGAASTFNQYGGIVRVTRLIIGPNSKVNMRKGSAWVRDLIINDSGVMNINLTNITIKAEGDQVNLLNDLLTRGKIHDTSHTRRENVSIAYDEADDVTTMKHSEQGE